ncbi:TMEM164 family-domain-containing protein [Radiomyces spectabilis]|uniref:TMEM164 family-domain-containing protein n=1 Tax=Radiomyces spectabilis TaxID=64574 RepID=UPI00221E7304|nr:TMEM164 family-domain-containing protein [Radiomyces spectabilis]KAI8374176.1 TMEM164 family-domain-containing protein [Radiomyces spectabilis]
MVTTQVTRFRTKYGNVRKKSVIFWSPSLRALSSFFLFFSTPFLLMRVLQKLGAIVEYWSFDFPPGHETNFEDSLGGAWYISPAHHALEFVILVPLFLALTLFFGWRAFGPTTRAFQLLNSPLPTVKASLLENILLFLLVLSLGVTIVHKAYTETLLFLFQPCHASAFILIIIMGWPSSWNLMVPRLLFNIYLHTLWGAILALVFPDLRDHDMFGEVANFFLEHALILVVPFYLLTTGRYVVLPPSVDMALFSFFLYAAYHSPILHLLSLTSGFNLNYVLVPPALGFLISAGPWYRFIMYMAALINMFLTRYGLVEILLRLTIEKEKTA